MRNYAMGIPMGNNQVPFFESPPAIKAIVSKVSENATASSMFSLSANTTAIEIATQGTAAAFKWVTAANAGNSVAGTSVIAIAGTTANFDHVVPANVVKRFIVPIEVINNVPANASFMGANVENGLFQWIAWKTQGVASVFMTEYGSSNSY